MTPERPSRSPEDVDELQRVAPLTGRTVGDFLIGERLAGGGFGVIYYAEQLTLGREVVIKVLRQQPAPGDAGDTAQRDGRRQRFLREAQLASRLDHPYAAHIYAFGIEDDGLFWIAMELVRGIAMKELLVTRGPFSLARFVPFFERICEVVYTAHQQGIIHRDIKPSNVMVLSRAGQLLPKLLDLGIARMLSDEPTAVEREETSESAIDIAAMAEAIAGTGSGPSTVTLGERALGSPPYMAPEQWGRAFAADARADQYSLAVLAYEAITGHRPFQSSDAAALAAAHMRGQVPEVGPEFPSALNGVFARALAKKPDERYADVMEFARELRTASGLEGDTDKSLPRLDSGLRDSLLTRAPQPLADTIALLDSGHDPRRAALAATQTTRVLARLLGILAVASITRMGLGRTAAPGPVRAALRRLRKDSPSLSDWLASARALVQPFADKPDAHPIPELVLALSESSVRRRSPDSTVGSGASLRSESALGQLLVLEKDFTGREPLTALEAGLPVLEQLLRRLSFLCDYRMVARHQGRDEVRMGARRASRPTLIVHGLERDLEDGDVVLVGADGALILRLSPWCRLLAPAPGALAEIFMFDGRSRLGARLRAFPIGFEWHDQEFWPWYDSEMRDIDPDFDDPSSQADLSRRAPYLGLSAFGPGDRDNYFGREREVGHCVNRLLLAPLLAVVGPSGAGKSSFVQAGILPSLPDNWRALVVRPGTAPLSTLCTRLLSEWLGDSHEDLSREQLMASIQGDPAELGRILTERANAEDEILVIVVDQFEELITLSSDHEERQLYAEALALAARSARDVVRVIITVRDDFLLRIQSLSALRERLGEALQLLATPPVDELKRILIQPARRAGYEFEDEVLPQEMVEAIADESGALALLSFTAAKLWELRDTGIRQLRRRAYRELGGVGGALAQHAEETLEQMNPGQGAVVREAFRHLVTAEGTRAVLTRSELSELLNRREDSDSVVEALIGARLLVASEGEGGQDRVEVVHEALLSSWPRLVRWQREDAESARLRDQLRAAARQWDARGRPQGLLWRGDVLLEYRLWRARYDGALTDAEQQFARLSIADEERGMRRRKALIIGVFVTLLAGLMSMLYLQQRTEEARQLADRYARESASNAENARQSLLALYVEQGRQALRDGDALRALTYLTKARTDGADSASLRFLLARTIDALSDQRRVIDTGSARLSAVSFSADGTRIASGDRQGMVKLWNAQDGSLARSLTGHTDDVWTLSFDRAGTRLLSGSLDSNAHLWELATGTKILSVGHRSPLWWAAYDPSGQYVATAGTDRRVTVHVADTGQSVVDYTVDGPITSGAFSADGRLVAFGDGRGHGQIREFLTGKVVLDAAAQGSPIMAIGLSSDGKRIGMGRLDGSVWLASGAGGAVRRTAGHRRRVNRALFSPDERYLLTVAEDHAAVLWAVDDGRAAVELRGHEGGVTDAVFNADGTRVFTVGRDGQAIAWDPVTGTRLWTFLGHRAGIWRVALDGTTQTLATAGLDGELHLWDATHTADHWSVSGLDSSVMHAVFSPDGGRVATVRANQDVTNGLIVEVFDLAAGAVAGVPRPICAFFESDADLQKRGARLAWSPDNERIAVAGGPSTVVLKVAAPTKLVAVARLPERARHVVFNQAGDALYTAGQDHIGKRWDIPSGEASQRFVGHSGPLTSVDIDHTGRYLLTASEDASARIWAIDSGHLVKNLPVDTEVLTSARFSADGSLIIVTGRDQSARILAVDGKLVASLDGHTDAVLGAAISRDGKLAVTGSRDGTVKVWDVPSGALLWSTERRAGSIVSLQFDAPGERVLVAQGKGATIWSMTYDHREPSVLQELVACRSGYQLRAGRLEYVTPDRAACNRRASSLGLGEQGLGER